MATQQPRPTPPFAGQFLKIYRNAHKLTQEQLTVELSIEPRTPRAYENGECNLHLSCAKAFPCRTVFYTPPVSSSIGRIEREVMGLCASLSYLVEAPEQASRGTDDFLLAYRIPKRTELVIVDEANRLKEAGLEQLRDLNDRCHFGLVLIGMPGLEKRLARYPQLYSRVGFVHRFRVLSEDETRFVLKEPCGHLGVAGQIEDWTSQEAVTSIVRITAGHVRLIPRLLMQVERILPINELKTVTKEVVEAARENLVIGLA